MEFLVVLGVYIPNGRSMFHGHGEVYIPKGEVMANGLVFGLLSKVICKTIVGVDSVAIDVINTSKTTNVYKAYKVAEAKAKAEEAAKLAASKTK